MTHAVLSLVLLAAPTFGPPKDQVVGTGNSATETRELAEFDEIEFRVAGDFTVTIAEKPTPLVIEADDNILPLITTEVVEGRLIVDSEKPFKTKHSPDFKVSVDVSFPIEVQERTKIADELAKLVQLFEDGVLNEQELEAAKAKLLE